MVPGNLNMESQKRESLEKGEKINERVLVIAQELKLIRVLAGNDPAARKKAIYALKKWFKLRLNKTPFTENDMMRIWKGLFYNLWMCDKLLPQEECAENISNLIHSLCLDDGLLFFKCGLKTLINEWFGIDHWRRDKFKMFVRRLLRQCVVVLKNEQWGRDSVRQFTNILGETVLNIEEHKQFGFLLHFLDIYMEEVAKISEGQIRPLMFTQFIRPFIKLLATTDDKRIIQSIKKNIFAYLIKQSDVGLDYQERYEAWKGAGFPGSINSMQKIEHPVVNKDIDGDDDIHHELLDDKPLDPRAGCVNVELPQIKFSTKKIVEALLQHQFDKESNAKSRKALMEMVEQFKKLEAKQYPLGITSLQVKDDGYDANIRKAVNRLVKLDKKLMGKDRKKKRKRQAQTEAQQSSSDCNSADDSISERVPQKLQNITKNKKIKLDPAVQSSPEITNNSPKSFRKQSEIKSDILQNAFGTLESIFRRNSGTWFVTHNDEEVEVA